MPRVLVGPAPLRDLDYVFGPILAKAGLEPVYPPRQAQMTEGELQHHLPGCVAAIAGSEPYTPAAIATAAAAGLRVIARAGVGYDGIDVPAATAHGIPVTIAIGSNQDAVAEHAIMLMLAVLRNMRGQDIRCRAGEWPRRAVRPLRGCTVGLFGLGRTGGSVAWRLKPFDVTVIGCDPYIAPERAADLGVTLVAADEVFRQSDVVSLHVPLTPETRKLVNERTLGLMKPDAVLVNTSRGPVVDEVALDAALRAAKLHAAGLDVFVDEPLLADHPFCSLENVVLTAHTAGVDLRSREDMVGLAAQAVVRLLSGDWPAEWVVNPDVRSVFQTR